MTIPNSVSSIGSSSFSGCTGLTSITIPYSVSSIGYSAFSGCTGLTSITIPNNVTSIEAYAFKNCTGLAAIIIPNSIASIGGGAFSGCSGITSIELPNTVTSIGFYAFEGCTGLTSMTIPNSVSSIGSSAFEGCTGLTSITIGNSVSKIEDRAFKGCTGLTGVTIPNSVTSIGFYAFEGCTGLTSMTIPNSVSSIGSGAFEGCTGLTSISVNALNTSYVDIDGVLFKKDKTTIIAYPCGKQGAYTIIPSVTSIEDEAFYGCSGLTSVTIPNSVTSIGLYAFYGCTGLESLTLLNTTFLMIDGEAFSYCTGLKEITCMAMQPPCADNHFIFDGVSLSIPLYVPLSSISLYQQEGYLDMPNSTDQYYNYWSYFTNIKPIQAKDASVAELIVEPADDKVVFSWPKDDAATTYTIEIKKNGELVCTLSFNDLGQLLNINYASLVHMSRRSSGQPRTATQTTTGWQYEINNLDPASKYTYSVIARGANEAEVYNKSGEFTTTKNGEVVTVYIITFVDKNNQIIAIQHVEQGGTVVAPEVEGYHVSNTDKPLTNIQADQTIKVLYEINTYTIRFVDWNDQELKSETVEYGKSATAPADPSREGYTFTGWDKEFTNIQSDLIIRAQYAANTFTVRFVDWNDQELKSETVEYGKSATAPVDPSREGYTFTGWDKEFTNIQSDLTVKAQYAIQTFVVKFVDWDDKELKSDTVEYGKSAIAPADPSREGYNFKGWDKEFTNVQSDLTVKARYTIQTFTVKFVDWDDKELKSETVEYGKSATAPTDPSREGYTFKGWDKEFTNVQSDLVVKAVYEKNPDEAIDEINAENVVSQKVIRNGQLLILRNGKVVNVLGQSVR